MICHCYILEGGIWGVDGIVDSTGMVSLANRIKAMFPQIQTETHYWSSYVTVENEIKKLFVTDKVILIGYSGGGSRATYVANDVAYSHKIDLIIGYDPSPKGQMQVMKSNVVRAVTYYNTSILSRISMLGLGGGQFSGSKSTQFSVHSISQQHLAVQFNEALHQITFQEIKQLIAQK